MQWIVRSPYFVAAHLLLLLLLAQGQPTFALTNVDLSTAIIELNEQQGQFEVGEKLQFFEDKHSIYALRDVVNFSPSEFSLSDSATLNLGFTKSTYWLKFIVSGNRLQSGDKTWLIQVAFPSINELDVYIYDNDGSDLSQQVPQSFHTGTNSQFDTKPIPHRNFLFPLDITPEANKTVLMRVKATNALQLPVLIWEETAFNKKELIALISWGSFLGMIIVMSLYNLFIFLFVRDLSYLYYIFYINSVMVVVLGLNGIGFQLLWPDNPEWNRLSITFFAGSLVFFAVQFERHFLETSVNAPKLDLALILMNICAISLSVASFAYPNIDFSATATAIVLLFSMLTLASGLYCFKKGVRSARYFLTAWIVFLSGLFLYTLSLYSILPSIFLTNHAKEIGAALEMMLLSLGLADRINTEKKEKIRALESQNDAIRGLKQAERRLYHKALHDDLTNLPNRKLLQREMPLVIDSALKQSEKLAVVIFRLNRLLEIYNTLGPNSKETLYKQAASRIMSIVNYLGSVVTLELLDHQHQYLVAIDDHSFAIVLEKNDSKDIKEHLETQLDTFIHDLNMPFQHRGMFINLDICVGISYVPEHGLDIDTLIQHAEVAVEAASLRQPQWMVYSPSIDPYSAKRLSLMGELRDAINENRLLIEFQPQLDLNTNSIVAAEALLRWYHPAHGHIPPEETIKMAQQSGLLKPLTHWILDKALHHASEILREYPDLKICMNISSKNLREPDLIDEITNALTKHRVAPNNLNIEITESDMMEDPELALNILTRLANKGIHISIDDFGTGYSSLSYLSALPVNELKIDKFFIQAIKHYDKQKAIVHATINMGNDLGLKVVAEGVEDHETLMQLRQFHCHIAQGFYIGRPIPGHQFGDWINQSNYRPKTTKRPPSKSKPNVVEDLFNSH